MIIGCLQFAPEVGKVGDNISRADALLDTAATGDLDLLVLPEMAFSVLRGDNAVPGTHCFGVTSSWAKATARKYNCVVHVGYPEKAEEPAGLASPKYYNSTLTVNPRGDLLAHYRKSFLYYTDDTWASEGPGFYSGKLEKLGNVAMGICMDLNPYKFLSPWASYEFAKHILTSQSSLAIISMAWSTREEAAPFHANPDQPCMRTLSYWAARLQPLVEAGASEEAKPDTPSEEVILVLANRTGVEGDTVYAGTSAVLGIVGGQLRLYGLLGRGDQELLVADTESPTGRLVTSTSTASDMNE